MRSPLRHLSCRFSLRTLLALIAVLSVLGAWSANEVSNSRTRQAVLKSIRDRGADIRWRDSDPRLRPLIRPMINLVPEPAWEMTCRQPGWWRAWLGEELEPLEANYRKTATPSEINQFRTAFPAVSLNQLPDD